MSRRHLTFACEGARLAGTLDPADGTAGLLLVSGGNEVRSGAWAGQARFAARIAAAGFPVFRFDLRGTGDSEGDNAGFRSSAPDIAAALAIFRRECPAMTRVVGLGNCDAASALMLARGAGLDALLLSNPWTFNSAEDEAPPAATRAHYRQRLADPAAIRRLLTGKVALGGLVRSLIGALRPGAGASGLAREMAEGIGSFTGPVTFLIAERDRTGQAFLSTWKQRDALLRLCPDATHSYVEPHAREWLVEQVVEALRG